MILPVDIERLCREAGARKRGEPGRGRPTPDKILHKLEQSTLEIEDFEHPDQDGSVGRVRGGS
jgi:hypothetical protein